MILTSLEFENRVKNMQSSGYDGVHTVFTFKLLGEKKLVPLSAMGREIFFSYLTFLRHFFSYASYRNRKNKIKLRWIFESVFNRVGHMHKSDRS